MTIQSPKRISGIDHPCHPARLDIEDCRDWSDFDPSSTKFLKIERWSTTRGRQGDND